VTEHAIRIGGKKIEARSRKVPTVGENSKIARLRLEVKKKDGTEEKGPGESMAFHKKTISGGKEKG